MRWSFSLCVVSSIFVAGCNGGHDSGFGPYSAAELEPHLQRVRDSVFSIRPDLLTETDPLVKAIELRDEIYQRVQIGLVEQPFPFTEIADSFSFTLFDAASRQRCGGLAIALLQGLRALGVTARYAGLYPTFTGTYPLISHATVEVLVDGDWVAVDPTFNITLEDSSGHKLGYREVAQLYASGAPVVMTSDGKSQFPDRLPENYVPSLASHAQWMVFSPFWNVTHREEGEVYPPWWDGKLQYSDGDEFDARSDAASGVYQFLSVGTAP